VMKAHLLYPDRDFDWQAPQCWSAEALSRDLGLQTLVDSMANGDKFLFHAARKVLLSSLSELDIITYRQAILRDCLANAAVVRGIYEITVEAIERERKDFWRLSTKSPRLNLSRAVDVLEMFLARLARLRGVAERHAPAFHSEGFMRLFAMLKRELPDDYLATVRAHLKQLRFPDGVLVSAELGKGIRGANYALREAHEAQQGWINRIFGKRPAEYTFHLHPRDQSGFEALSELRDRGINAAANALSQSSDHVLSFFQLLRSELAFYLGCLNLHERLAQKGAPTCFPVAIRPGERRHTARGLYDLCLVLRQTEQVVGNDLEADGKGLVIITGANQGGKSTFLRSIGLAQLMMQCGMVVPAKSFCADVRDGIFTHFKREEDATMESGKLDEELRRMSEIADHITSNSVVLFNESFAATNEREGSEIARQITSALSEKHVKIFFVTHLSEFARNFFEKKMDEAVFLRAERRSDGVRTFRLLEGEPLQTSYGEDLYHRIFNSGPDLRKAEMKKEDESARRPFAD
jgi:adenosyl cobinamide kinase/adenosyl cobinamide phosphate guanylyltransferase